MNVEIKNCPVEIANDIWNAAIEAAIQICNAYDRGFSTDAGMIKLKIMELKK